MKNSWNLERYGYYHLTVNHSPNFVDPISNVHTQNIEANWRSLKARLYTGGHRQDSLTDQLCEFLWRREVKKSGSRLFDTLIRDISRIEWWKLKYLTNKTKFLEIRKINPVFFKTKSIKIFEIYAWNHIFYSKILFNNRMLS